MDYLLAQSLSLVFYFITLIVYNRARKEYVGGKIAAAIKLIMVFMVILFLSDFADYFAALFLPLDRDSVLIIKIILKLIAICVLFFGGIKFFVSKPAAAGPVQQAALSQEIDVHSFQPSTARTEPNVDSTAVLDDAPRSQPSLGRYEILEQIGTGAMGMVYKGLDPKLQRLTAIKTIRFTDEFDESQAEEVKEQFYREAEMVAQLSHPNIVTIYDVGEDLDLSYLAMEYLEGESLAQYTKADNLLSIGKCIDVVIQVCDALEYAHNHGIVHRDIKPANIMLLENGLVKVTDFGIARVAASSKTHTGIIKGTPYYMSPEQAKGLKVAGSSDIFSLGVVFYQLLTGRFPFSGESMAAIVYQTTTMDPEPPTTYNPKISKATITILDRCLEKNLQKRYQTAKQMGDQLRLLRQKLTTETEAEFEKEVVFERVDLKFETNDIYNDAYLKDKPPQAIDSDFPDQETFLEPGDKSTKEVVADSEEFIDLAGSDIFYDPIVSETEQPFEDELVFSNFKQVAETSPESDESVSVSTPYGTPHPGTENHDKNLKARKSAIEIEDKEKPDTMPWSAIQGEKDAAPDFWSTHAKRIVFYGCLFLFVSGIGCYFYWKSSQVKVSIIKKRFKLPVDIHNTKTYVPQQKQEPLAKKAKKDSQQQAQQQRLANIEKEKQAQKERLVSIEKEKQAQKERLANIKKEKQAQKERLANIEKEKQAQKKHLAKIEKEKKEAVKRKEINEIDNLISKAKKSFNLKKYSEAKNRYDSTLKIIEKSDFRAEKSFITRKKQIETALINENIVYGSKGYIQFKDKWYPPDEYENQLRREGFVKYKGKFKKYTKLKTVIRQVTYPKVSSFLTSKYSGRNIHKKQIKLHRLKLKQNTRQISYFTVLYKWEVWTFNEIGEGQCSLDLHYDAKQDMWSITKGCE